MNFKSNIVISIFLVLTVPSLHGEVCAQESQPKSLTGQKRELQRIREEIEKYKRKIFEEKRKETSILDLLASLDREVDGIQQLLYVLKKEERTKQKQIEAIERNLEETTEELSRLQSLCARRMVNFYKYGRVRDIELLLSSRSLNEAYLWIKFQRLLAENDRRNFQNIIKKKAKIEKQRKALNYELAAKRKIIEEKKREENNLKNKRKEREKILIGIQENKEIYLQKLKEYELSAQEIQRLISVEEERRLSALQRGVDRATNFPQLKGRMIWPTQGNIIHKFGKYKHPQLKTITENLGIDIRSDLGQEVKSVGRGVVTAITWQRGRGNIVIINHFGGYYTVYTHLSRILVTIDEEVEMGQVIGHVGDSGSLEGPILHFEIWKNNQVLNPQDWLG